MHIRRLFFLIVLPVLVLSFPSVLAASNSNSVTIPLTFERNDGQAPARYRYLSRHEGVQVLFAPGEADFLVPLEQHGNRLLRMRFVQAPPNLVPQPRVSLAGHDNYFVGNDPSRWRSGIPTYGEVAYPNIYPGIDLLFHGTGGNSQLEHDFVVAAGADPKSIRFRFDAADDVHLRRDGKLVVTVAGRRLIFDAPVAWQTTAAGKTQVKSEFRIDSDGTIGFAIPVWDHSRALTIDPVLVWGSYLDGTGSDSIAAIATDATGNLYVTGTTNSTDFPTAAPEQAKIGTQDVFISKLDPTGHTLLYSTYLGGSNGNQGFSIAVDGNGNVAVSGISMSSDFPSAGKLSAKITTATVTYNFIASLTSDGSQLRYSGFIGDTPGSFDDYNPRQNLVIFDAQGNAYLSGKTQDDYPWTIGAYGGTPASYPADSTLFITKIGSDGTIVWAADVPEASSPGPWGHDIDLGGLAVDSAGEVVVGGTVGTVLPVTSGVIGPTFPNDSSALYAVAGYVLKLNAQGSALVFSTYLPGTDAVEGLAQDASGNVYLSGLTQQTNLPTNSTSYQASFGQSSTCDCSDAYVLELNSDGTKVQAATYFNGFQLPGAIGGPGTVLRDIRVDPSGNIAVIGLTSAANLPMMNPLISTFGTLGLPVIGDTLLVARFSPDLSKLEFSSFLNPPDDAASASAMTTDGQGHIIVAGTTESKQFPTTPGAFQPTVPAPPNSYTILNYQFLASIDVATAAPSLCFDTTSVSFGTILVNSEANATVNITNCGNAPLSLTNLASSSPVVSATNNCNGVAAGATCQVDLTYAPMALGNTSGTLSIVGNMSISPQVVSFSGAAGAPNANFPSSITFASLLVGQTGAKSSIGVFNTGNAPFILTSATVTGDFAIFSNGCAAPIAAHGSCLIVLNFSPTAAGTRNGTLALVDNLASPTQTISLVGVGLTSAPLPGISSIPAIPMLSSGTGQVTVYGANFLPNSTINWNGSPLVTSYISSGTLVGVVPLADLQQVGEASVTVSSPPPGGGTSGNATVTIYGRLQNITVLNEVYDPATQLLYAAVSSASTNNANSLVAIDPVAMKVVATLLSGNQPDVLALSSDGTLLYVGLDSLQSVAQLSLPSGAVNFTVKVPSGGNSFLAQNGMTASALATVPGQPHSWLVGICYVSTVPCGGGVAMFDDAVERANQAAGIQLTANSFSFVSDPGLVYSTEFNQTPPDISSYSISASGISKTATSSFLPGVGGSALHTDGKLLYVANGQVIDPSTLNLKFTYPQGGTALALDTANQRLFFTSYLINPLYLTVVDQSTQATIGAIRFPEFPAATDVQRFGANGVIINKQNGGLLFVQTSLTTAAVPAQSVFISPASLTFANQGVNTTSGGQVLTITNGTSATINLNGIAATGDFTQINNCGTTLAANTSCNISVAFAPTAAGDRTGQVTVTYSGNPGTLTVPLHGTGASPLALAPATNGSSTVTVTAGSTATYNLSLLASGYSGPITLTCSGAPVNAVCSISPSSVNVTTGQSLPFTVTITTSGQTAVIIPANQGLRMAGLGMLGLTLLPLLYATRRRARNAGLLLCLGVFCFAATGCGGGSSSSTSVSHNSAPGTYTITVTATGNGISATQQLTLIVQ